MKTSESISKIAPALLSAQKAITFAARDATNPAFRSKYADLPSVVSAVKTALNEAGIVFMQAPTDNTPGTLSLTTRLIHESGEWIEDTATTPFVKQDPQGYGSAITYLRRYALAAMTGVYQDDDDDDGNQASKPVQKQTSATQDKSQYITADQVTQLQDMLQLADLTAKALCTAANVPSLAKIEKLDYARAVTWISKHSQTKEVA